MNTLNTKKPTSSKFSQQVNPFAQALAETEKPLSETRKPAMNPFSEALARSGGKLADPLNQNQTSPDDLKRQQEEAEKQRKKELLRQKLHKDINQVNSQREVFSAREKKVKQEIESLRKELKMLAKDIAVFHKEIDIAVTQEVVNPGDDGTYYINFFQKLRAFIMLLRQKIKSARTWANQMHAKNAKKKKRKIKGGLDFGGNEAKASHDMMHHEVSNAYSGS